MIVAPAGYGKTSLAAQWHDRLRAAGEQVVWIGLDTEHSNQNQLIHVFLHAISDLLPGEQIARDMATVSPASLIGILTTRFGRIAQPLVLFLDDYHLAQTDATEAVMARLLANRGLEHLKFVIISRATPRFPISSLRLDNQLKQIGAGDLAFSDLEAKEFFTGHGIGLTADQIGSLNRRTEGWAVALQMVRVLLTDHVAADDILAYIASGTAEMGNYLSEQVLANLPEPIRRLLLETAALPAFNRQLAAAVSDDPDAAARFQELTGFALPLAYLGGQGGWIRCHPVFNAFLVEEARRRGVDTCRVLQSAAGWFERQGDCDAAVRHALLSGDANLAAQIIEDASGWQRVYATARGGMTMFQAIISKMAEIDLGRFPLTTLGLCIISAKSGRLDAADHYLALAQRSAGHDDKALAGDLRVVNALLALYTDRRASDAELSALEDDLMRRTGMELIHRALALNMLCYNALIRGELERTLHYGQLAIHAFRDGNADFGAMHLYTHIGQAAFFSGDCIRAAEAYDQLIAEAQRHIGKRSDLDAVGQVLKAELLSMNGEESAAADMLEWALPHLERHDTWFDLLAAGFLARQRLLLLKRDQIGAHASIDRFHAAARRRGFDRLNWLVEGERVRLLLAFGDVEQAIRYAEARGMGPGSVELSSANNLAINPRGEVPALLWTRIQLAQGDHVSARNSFAGLMTRQTRKPNMPRSIELTLMEIRLLLAEGRADEAAKRLGDLVLGSPLGDYQAILCVEGEDFLEQLRTLASNGLVPQIVAPRLAQSLGEDWRQSAAAASGLRQVDGLLTSREQNVMELLSSGLSNKQIGRKLDMSGNTVKFHLRNIYAKLEVGTRLAAVSVARERGVLANR